MGFLQTFTGGGSLSYKTPVRAASTANVALSGTVLSITPLGGVILAHKDRVLLKDQTNPAENGIYVITINGPNYQLVRATDSNNDREIVPGMLVPVTEGDFEEEVFQLQTNAPIDLDVTGLSFIELDSVVEAAISALELLKEEQVVYVRKGGNDSTGNGGPHRPFLTIQAALQSITDASPSKRYVIKVASGAYTEVGNLALKANVFIVGESKDSVRITATSFVMAGDFTGSADNRSGISQAILTGTCDFNWATVTSAAGKLYFNEVSFSNGTTLTGHNNSIAQAHFNSCQLFGNLTITGVNVGVFTNNICFADVTLNQHASLPSLINATGGHCNGTVRFNAAVSNFNRRSAGFLRSFWCENLISDGPSAYVDFDLDSGSKQGAQSLNGGNLVPLTPEIHHDITTRMVRPKSTNAHYSGDFGRQWFFNFAYVHASTGTDLYLMSTASSFGADSVGRSVFILPDAYGLQSNVSGGDIVLETQSVSGTGVRGKIELDAREVDVVNTKIVNLANGTNANDAVNKSQLDLKVSSVSASAPISSSGGVTPTISISDFGGATSVTPGSRGSVPAPAAGDQNKFLRGDSTWADVNVSALANTSLSNLTSPTAVNQVLRGLDGTAAAPAYSFTSDPDTGIYNSGANSLSFATNGVEAVKINSSGITKLKAELSLKSVHNQSGVINVSVDECYIGCNSSAAVTVNLPSAASAGAGKKLIIKDETDNAAVNFITIQPSGSDLIDLQPSYVISVGLESVTLICNGVDKWFIV